MFALNLKKILENCRLCQQNFGIVSILENEEFVNQVFECTKIKLSDNYTQLFPKAVCLPCKRTIEEFFSFLQSVRLVDENLHNQFNESQKIDVDEFSLNTNISIREQSSKEHKETKIKHSKTYTRREKLQIHKSVDINLYCKVCEETFNDMEICSNHKCNIIKKSCVKEEYNCEDASTFVDVKPTTESSVEVKNENSDITVDTIQMSDNNSSEQISDTNVTNRKSNLDVKMTKQSTITYPCTYDNCNKICTSLYTLRTHVMRHEGRTPFLCVTCGKGFTTKNSLNCHEKIHSKIKAYACQECNISFSVASNLRTHQKKYHEGVRFYCSQCTRVFITKCSLQRHELVHTGIKEFKCASCQAAFYTSKELIKHQRYHQGIRLYKCEQCFKTFFEKHHLTIHIRVHTGERPYVCKVSGCGKSFTESQKLSRHMKARHPLM